MRNAVRFFSRFHLNNYGLTVDLGIPGQTGLSFHNTLRACTICHPAHIRIQCPDVRDAEGMPDGETRFAWYADACSFLKESGYLQYAAGDFCLPQHASRYTLAELNGAEVLALGLGAVSLLDGYLTRSTTHLPTYLAHAGDYEKTTAEVFSAGTDYLMRDYAAKRLRTPEGLSRESFEARFGCKLPAELETELRARAGQALLTETPTSYVPTVRGLFTVL